MSFQSTILPVLTGGGSATLILTGGGALAGKFLRRVATEVVHEAFAGVAKESDLKAVASDVTDLKVKLAAETGGNSHGLRQAVNELDGKVDGIVVDVATLKAKAAG